MKNDVTFNWSQCKNSVDYWYVKFNRDMCGYKHKGQRLSQIETGAIVPNIFVYQRLSCVMTCIFCFALNDQIYKIYKMNERYCVTETASATEWYFLIGIRTGRRSTTLCQSVDLVMALSQSDGRILNFVNCTCVYNLPTNHGMHRSTTQ